MVIPLHDDNPTERFPFVTVAIIALNVLVYLFVQPHSGVDSRLGTSRDTAFTLEHAAIPCELRQGQPATVRELNTGTCTAAARADSKEVFPGKNVWFAVIASMFLHGSILHIAGNMLFLWIFGNNVEDHLGHIGFTVFYFVVGVAAMAAHYLADPGSTYLVYLPRMGDRVHIRFVGRLLRVASMWVQGRVDVDLSAAHGALAIEWLNPRTGEILHTGSVQGGGRARFSAPFGGDAILYLKRAES